MTGWSKWMNRILAGALSDPTEAQCLVAILVHGFDWTMRDRD